jgi:deferrochelatase/peroxidase EfeB
MKDDQPAPAGSGREPGRAPGIGRRGLLGSLAGAAAAGATLAVAAPAAVSAAESGMTPGLTDTDDGPAESFPFDGPHQQGILTPLQVASTFLAFDVVAASKDELAGLFRDLTGAARLLTQGGTPPDPGLAATAVDSGVVGDVIAPDGLTVTFSVGASLFDERYGLAALKPAGLRAMTAFPNDRLDPAWCGGDLMVQLCAHHPDTVVHAMRYLSRVAAGRMVPRWRRAGFASPPRPSGTPRNLLGFKDGTSHLDTSDETVMDSLVWVQGGVDGEPAWATGGTYHVVRLIRMLVEFWDRVNLNEQEKMIGRRKVSGAPLSGTDELDVPDFLHDPSGESIPTNAHIRLANPRLDATEDSRILRRPYNYDAGLDPNGQYDQGLAFVCFNRDLDRQFVAIQTRLVDEPLVDYISPFGGDYFFALPGVKDETDWLGSALLA